MKNLIVLLAWVIALVLFVQVYRPVKVRHPGYYPRNPDNWQAQSQKKEGTLLCPPFCEYKQQFGIGKRQE